MSTLETMCEGQKANGQTVEVLGKDLRGLINEMLQHLETRDDDLTQQLEQKRGENATLQGVVDKGQQERETLQRQLLEANATRKAQEDRIQELVQTVHKLQAQPQGDPEAELRSQALVAENDDLKAQLTTKASSISNLQNQLNRSKESHKAEVDSLSKEISKLNLLMYEKDEVSRTATEKAVATAQEEHQAELERIREEMQARLQEARDARKSAVHDLDETRKKLEALEASKEGNERESNKISALQTAVDEAEGRNRKLVQDLHGMEAKLSAQNQSFESIGKWASGKVEAQGLALNLGKIWEDASADGDDAKRWTVFLETLILELMQHASVREALPATVALPPAPTPAPAPAPVNTYSRAQPMPNGLRPILPTLPRLEPVKQYAPQVDAFRTPSHQLPGPGLDDTKRATVMSPHFDVLTPVPPSVEQEKSRRRGGMQQPKSIIKRITRSTPHASELIAGQDIDLASLSPRSGKSSKRPRKADEPAPEADSASLPVPHNPDPDPIEDEDNAPQPKKARTQKPKTPSGSRRGRGASSQAKQQTPRSGLAARGVVHGRLPPGVPGILRDRHPLPSEPKHLSQP